MDKRAICSECGAPIPPERLAVSRNAKTCSGRCSDDRARKRRSASSRRSHARARARKKEESK